MQVNEHLNTDDIPMVWLQAARQIDTLNRLLNDERKARTAAVSRVAELEGRVKELEAKQPQEEKDGRTG